MKNITKATKKPVAKRDIEIAIEEGWSERDIERGYSYFTTELGIFKPYDPKVVGNDGFLDARHIEVLGILGAYNSDREAALYGVKFYGEKVFRYDLGDDEEISLYWFVDEPETRKSIEDYLVRKYGGNHGFKPSFETN